MAAKRPGEYLDTVIPLEELAAMLAPFGMIVQINPGADRDYQAMQMAHALVGVVEAHASRAEDAYRRSAAAAGTDEREVHADVVQASLMAFAGINARSTADELALICWRATRLAGVLGTLDFPGPIKRNGPVGSGDALIRTLRLAAAAVSGMATAAEKAADPRRGPGEAAEAGQDHPGHARGVQDGGHDARVLGGEVAQPGIYVRVAVVVLDVDDGMSRRGRAVAVAETDDRDGGRGRGRVGVVVDDVHGFSS
jgi:hypothetical protein